MICIYHSKDLDGYCSGAIVKLRFPEAKLIGYDYGQPFPWDEITGLDSVIMIDVSLPMVDMDKLAMLCRGLTWIDHHVSAINDYKNYIGDRYEFLVSVLRDGVSACELGWNYLFKDRSMPTAVKLLGEYDTWRNQDKDHWDNAVMPFQYGMRMICSSAETFPKELLAPVAPIIYDITKTGKDILEYQKVQNERACRCAFEIEFEGLRAIVLNNGGANSQVFESVYDESRHDIMMPFVFTGKHWTFSIYTTKPDIDCSVLAKKHGGGGHKKAAGFQVKSLDIIFTSNFPAAIKQLVDALNEGKEPGSYYHSWMANISMALWDEIKTFSERGEIKMNPQNSGAVSALCDAAAKRFIEILCAQPKLESVIN